MARIKQSTRKKSTKRLPLAVMPVKNPRNIGASKAKQNHHLPEIKQTSSSSQAAASSWSSNNSSSRMWSYFSFPGPNETSFSQGQTNKMQGLPEDAGKWLLFSCTDRCDLGGASHHSYTWKVAKALVKDFKNTGIISAKCSSVEESEPDTQGTVCCYTSNYKDKLSVKRAADAIFKAYPYPLSMYYKTENNVEEDLCDKFKKKVVVIYKYTIENKFYQRCASDSYNWQLVEFKNEAVPAVKEAVPPIISYREVMPCIVASHQWLYVSSFEQNGERFVVCSLNYVEDLPETAGKWLLFNNSSDVCSLGGVTHHDLAWKSLKHLVIDYKNSNIIAVKCSTNRVDASHPGKGVTCCYTANFGDKLSVKVAAKAIRNAFHYPGVMYYKTEEDSDAGICSRYGDRQITIYKHTPEDELYERAEDHLNWKLID